MQKSIYISAALGLLLLAACGVTEPATISRPDTPAPELPMTEEIMVTEEPPAPTESVAKEPTATREVTPTEEMAAPTEEVIETVTKEMMADDKETMAEQVNMPRPTEAQQQLLASLPVVGTPPELNNEMWLNSNPLQLANLRGKVVIVEFWTYG
jgi:hypothetical protein